MCILHTESNLHVVGINLLESRKKIKTWMQPFSHFNEIMHVCYFPSILNVKLMSQLSTGSNYSKLLSVRRSIYFLLIFKYYFFHVIKQKFTTKCLRRQY